MTRTLGIDYGSKRLGFAISDPLGMIATPMCVETVNGVREAAKVSKRLCEEREAELIVIGLPLNMDGSSGPAVQAVQSFIKALNKICAVPTTTWDERLTTSQIERTLIEADVSRAKRKLVRDKLAATVILQSYLDAQDNDL